MELALVADEREKRARDRLTYSAWGERLTVDDFVEREARLRAHPWARAAMATWFLRGDRGAVLSSCETFRMESRLRRAGGAVEHGVTFAVASVFTEPSLRGRRLASTMMEQLGRRLAESEPGADAPHAIILYSDVGPAMYQRAGYQEGQVTYACNKLVVSLRHQGNRPCTHCFY